MKMRSSRLGEPVLESSSGSGEKFRRSGEISTIESPSRRSKGSRSQASSSTKRKSSGNPRVFPSSPQPGRKCNPRLPEKRAGKGHLTTCAVAEEVVAATAGSNLHTCPSDLEQAILLQNFKSEISWPDCRSNNGTFIDDVPGRVGPPAFSGTNSFRWETKHAERDGVDGQIRWPSHSEASSSSCSLSDSDQSDLEWCTSSSSSSSSRGQAVRKTYNSFWEDLILGQRGRCWRKLRHKKSFLTNLWDFKTETKVESEICDPILVSVNVSGSPGPLRLLVDRNDSVHHTIYFALRRYAAQKRQPALVEPASFFGLYCLNPDFEALDDEALIGDHDVRQFHLYHKQRDDLIMESVDDALFHKSDGSTTSTPIRNWIWSKLNAMRSWAEGMVAATSRIVSLWAKDLNSKGFYFFLYIFSVKVLNVGMT